jgi:hypothetical protein
MTAPATHIAAISIVPELNGRFDLFERARDATAGFFDVADALERVDFFTGIDRPPWPMPEEQRRCPACTGGRDW